MRRKVIDEKGRLFGLISVIDIIVLIVAAVIVVAVITKFSVKDNPLTSANTVQVFYSIKVPAIRGNTANHIHPGDKVFLTETDTFMGTITDISITPAESIELVADGTYVISEVPERYDATLTIESQCTISSGRYFAERSIELNVSAEYWISTKYNAFYGTLMSLTTG